jgi:hypothetical protein
VRNDPLARTDPSGWSDLKASKTWDPTTICRPKCDGVIVPSRLASPSATPQSTVKTTPEKTSPDDQQQGATAAKGAVAPAAAIGAPGGPVVSDADIDRAAGRVTSSITRTVGEGLLRVADKLDDFNQSDLGHALQALPPEGAAVGTIKGGLIWLGRAATVAEEASIVAKSGVQILEREGNVVIVSFTVAKGEARVMAEVIRDGDRLILRGAHIEGNGTLKEALSAAKAFGREQGVKEVVIEGGARTTGANPGHFPRPITIGTGL